MSGSSTKRKAAATVVSGPLVLPTVANLQKPTLVALRMSLKTGVIIDSQFYLYSHRNLDGSVDKPRPIYASSKVLETAADHFRSLLSGGFCESFAGEDTGAPGRLRSSIAAYEYEYESDSDLDDDEDLEDDPNEVSSAATTEDEFHPIAMDVPVRHVVVIPDVAFRTFEALVYYTYSGEISFTTLRSARSASSETQGRTIHEDVVACSPKSMYRLADKYGLAVLKDLAAKNIRLQLSSKNAMHEIFKSRFSARYPAVMSITPDSTCVPYRSLEFH